MDDKHLHIEQWLKDAAEQSTPEPTGMDVKRQAWSKMSGLLDAAATTQTTPGKGQEAAPARTMMQKVWAGVSQAGTVVPLVAAAAVVTIVIGVKLYHNREVQTKQKQDVTYERGQAAGSNAATQSITAPVKDSGEKTLLSGQPVNIANASSLNNGEGITAVAPAADGNAPQGGTTDKQHELTPAAGSTGNTEHNAGAGKPGAGVYTPGNQGVGNQGIMPRAAGDSYSGSIGRQRKGGNVPGIMPSSVNNNTAAGVAIDNNTADHRPSAIDNNTGTNNSVDKHSANGKPIAAGPGSTGVAPLQPNGKNALPSTINRRVVGDDNKDVDGNNHAAGSNNKLPDGNNHPLPENNNSFTAFPLNFQLLHISNPFEVKKPALSSGSRSQHIPYSSFPPAKRAWQADGSRWAMQAGILLPLTSTPGASVGSALGVRLGLLYNLPLRRYIYLQPFIGIGYISGYDKRFTYMATGREKVRDSTFIIDTLTTPYTVKKMFVGAGGLNLTYAKGRWSVGAGITFNFAIQSGVQDTATQYKNPFRDTTGLLGPVTPASFSKNKLPGLRSLGWNLDAAYYVLPRVQVGVNYRLLLQQPAIDPAFNVPERFLDRAGDNKNKAVLDKSMLEMYIRIRLGR